MDNKKLVHASSISAVVVIAFVAIVTIASEELPAFKGWLKSFTGHHWVTKGVASVLLYLILLQLLSRTKKAVETKDVQKAIMVLVAASFLGTLAVLAYYTWHFISA